MKNVKTWVFQLSEVAQEELYNKIFNNLKNEGHDMDSEEMQMYMEDVKNEKLGNLDYHVTYEEMVQLSAM